jgi:uncharacterized membrane protein required for colicin V production
MKLEELRMTSKARSIIISVVLSLLVISVVVFLNYLVNKYIVNIYNSDTAIGLLYQGLKSVVVVIIALLLSIFIFLKTIKK